jgi:hypothetical protein
MRSLFYSNLFIEETSLQKTTLFFPNNFEIPKFKFQSFQNEYF